MSSRFTALPLSSGEAFVLETEHDHRGYVVLFDGGQSKTRGPENGLFKSLKDHCPTVGNRIDIAICSHSDHDHSAGFPRFVETWVSEGNEIGEFWLPALWSPAVPEVLTDPDRLITRLREGAALAARSIVAEERLRGTEAILATEDRIPAFRSIDQRIRSEGLKYLRERPRIDRMETTILADRTEESGEAMVARSLGLGLQELAVVRRNLEESHLLTVPLGERLSANRPQIHWYFVDTERASPEAFQLAETLTRSVIETAEAIQAIATVAVSHSIPIRWFDFTAFENEGAAPQGGISGFLEPLNTVEQRDVRREANSLALFYSLKLTEQNVSSLVFQRVETEGEPAVIFVADSRLAFGIDEPEKNFPNHLKPTDRACIFTAAHHGSRNNDRAYEVLEEWLGAELFRDSFAVRNGGVHNQTLDGFLKVGNRRCAQCYQCHGGDWSQLVTIGTVGNEWSWPPDQGGKCGTPKARRR